MSTDHFSFNILPPHIEIKQNFDKVGPQKDKKVLGVWLFCKICKKLPQPYVAFHTYVDQLAQNKADDDAAELLIQFAAAHPPSRH